jgi:hypothetical protein
LGTGSNDTYGHQGSDHPDGAKLAHKTLQQIYRDGTASITGFMFWLLSWLIRPITVSQLLGATVNYGTILFIFTDLQ